MWEGKAAAMPVVIGALGREAPADSRDNIWALCPEEEQAKEQLSSKAPSIHASIQPSSLFLKNYKNVKKKKKRKYGKN